MPPSVRLGTGMEQEWLDVPAVPGLSQRTHEEVTPPIKHLVNG